MLTHQVVHNLSPKSALHSRDARCARFYWMYRQVVPPLLTPLAQ